MAKKGSKAKSKRLARKRALRWVSSCIRDSIHAARRGWGLGIPK